MLGVKLISKTSIVFCEISPGLKLNNKFIQINLEFKVHYAHVHIFMCSPVSIKLANQGFSYISMKYLK